MYVCNVYMYVCVFVCMFALQLIEWWNEVAYLGFREPVVVHSNPAVGFPLQAHGDPETFAKYAVHVYTCVRACVCVYGLRE